MHKNLLLQAFVIGVSILVLVGVLAWSPWVSNEFAYQRIIKLSKTRMPRV